MCRPETLSTYQGTITVSSRVARRLGIHLVTHCVVPSAYTIRRTSARCCQGFSSRPDRSEISDFHRTLTSKGRPANKGTGRISIGGSSGSFSSASARSTVDSVPASTKAMGLPGGPIRLTRSGYKPPRRPEGNESIRRLTAVMATSAKRWRIPRRGMCKVIALYPSPLGFE